MSICDWRMLSSRSFVIRPRCYNQLATFVAAAGGAIVVVAGVHIVVVRAVVRVGLGCVVSVVVAVLTVAVAVVVVEAAWTDVPY